MQLQIEERTFIRKIDFNLVFVILALNIIGLINLFSATHDPETIGVHRLFAMQVFWICFGWLLFLVMTIIDYKILTKLAYFLYCLNLVFLVLVKFWGKSALGATRWLDLGFFKYQPSETMKLVLVILLAKILAERNTSGGLGIRKLLYPLLLTAIPFVMTVIQPDLGTSMMLAAVSVSLLLFVGIKKRILITAIVGVILVLPLAYNFALKDYQKNRVLTFIDPTRDPRGAGYNSIQSKIAVGSGKFLGKGFRKGTQSQLDFLPERHTDFIYSVLSEEHGFIGSFTVLTLFIILILIGIKIATQARDKFGALLVMGSLALIFWHMFVNIGMVIGILPIVGIPLPILSYGGSGMITTFLCLGIISSVAMRRYIF
jgi:rod shape determining protein RodA